MKLSIVGTVFGIAGFAIAAWQHNSLAMWGFAAATLWAFNCFMVEWRP